MGLLLSWDILKYPMFSNKEENKNEYNQRCKRDSCKNVKERYT